MFAQSAPEWANMFEVAQSTPVETIAVIDTHENEQGCCNEVQSPRWIERLGESECKKLLSKTYLRIAVDTQLHEPDVCCLIKKEVIRVSQMTLKQMDVYKELLKEKNLNQQIVWMKTHTLSSLIGASPTHRVSGRVVDSLMTKYPRFCDVHYYIDVTHDHTRYIPRQEYDSFREAHPDHRLILFNISSEYRSHMNFYSKTFFDPFQRGVEVLHPVGDGQFVTFSMCQLKFFLWAKQNHVFDYLKDNYEDISRIQREDQQRQRQYRIQKRHVRNTNRPHHKPKRKYRVVAGALCPAPIKHTRKEHTIPPVVKYYRCLPSPVTHAKTEEQK
jgi:hypothetical protein